MEKVTLGGFRGGHGGEWKVRTRCALGGLAGGGTEQVTLGGFRGEHGGEWKVRTRCALGEDGKRVHAKLVRTSICTKVHRMCLGFEWW